jgi:hypothetical protein
LGDGYIFGGVRPLRRRTNMEVSKMDDKEELALWKKWKEMKQQEEQTKNERYEIEKKLGIY